MIVDLVADYYCGDLCPVFASSATVMYPSKDVSSQISTMTSIVVGWSPSVSDKFRRWKPDQFATEFKRLLERQVRHACDRIAGECGLSGALVEEFTLLYRSLLDHVVSKPRIYYQGNHIYPSSFEFIVMWEFRRVFDYIETELSNHVIAKDLRRKCVSKSLEALRLESPTKPCAP